MLATERRTTPRADQLRYVNQAVMGRISAIDRHPQRRVGAYPYTLFHEPGESIHGTVLMFHGFSARPHQMWRLADYLFKNGFNVYQANLAGQALIEPGENWPQVTLREEYSQPLRQKVAADPVLSKFVGNLKQSASPTQVQKPGALQMMSLMARLVRIEPQILDIKRAIETPGDPDFDKYYESDHERYVTEALGYLGDLEAMPGPIFTVGLSVGGAVALGLAAAQPQRIQRVVTYAPLLETHGSDRRQYVELTGPLSLREMGWDPELQFPVSCLTATDRFGGSYVNSAESVKALRSVPTMMVLTENEDAADVATNEKFFGAIGGGAQGHYLHKYPAEDLVPHPMVDPTEISQGMSNAFWQTMYQETYRFLSAGSVNPEQLSSLSPSSDLPEVPPVKHH
ncbi:MAG: alpha/beta fold hydrolase [Cyanophyceae cyanobacterium]